VAQGIYKSGEQIDLTYQAVALLSNAIPVGTVFDEAGASDATKTASLTSQLLLGEKGGAAAGRYHGHFTPDAEGRWTVVIKDKNGAGEVSKTYQVVGHNIDAIGDAIAALPTADVASQLLITQSALDAMVLSKLLVTQSAINVATASDNLLIQSAINAATASDALLKQSAINAATRSQVLLMISAISDVESAVDTIAGSASVS